MNQPPVTSPVEAPASSSANSVSGQASNTTAGNLSAAPRDPESSWNHFNRPGAAGQFFGSPLASLLRSTALSAGVGAALAATLYFYLLDEGMRQYVISNSLPKADRTSLLKWMAASGGICALLTLIGSALFAWKKNPIVNLERWIWWLAPTCMFPLLPFVFDYRNWTRRSNMLLPIGVLLIIVCEMLFFRAFLHGSDGPRRLGRWLEERIPRFLKRHGWFALVVFGAVAYSVFFSYYSIIAHYSLKTHNFDLSINNNLLYASLHGKFFESTVVFGDEPQRYLATHVKLGQYVMLPIYALKPTPETLLALQATVLGLAAIPLFLFARRRLPQWMAGIIAIAFLLYAPVHSANFFEMHYLTMLPLFLIGAVWAAETRRWVWFGLLSGVAIVVRDDTGIGMAILGATFVLSGYRPKAGLALAIASALMFVITRGVWMRGKGDWWFPSMYDELFPPGEKSFSGVAKTLMTNPIYVVKTLITEQKLNFIMHMFVPLAFLPMRKAYLWALFIPGAVATILTTGYKPTVEPLFHYTIQWAPYLFVATPIAIAAIWRENLHGAIKAKAAVWTMALCSLVFSYNFGAWWMRSATTRGGYTRIEFEYTDAQRKRYAQLKELVDMIPRDASVSATESVGPHVSSRKTMYAIRMKMGAQMGEYVLLSTKELKLERTSPRLKEILKTKKSHGLLARRGEFVLLKRGAPTAHNDELLKEFKIN